MNHALKPSLDDFPAGCLVTDLERNIIFTNSYFETRYKHTTSKLNGTDLFRLLSRASQILYESYLIPLLLHEGRFDEIQLGLVTADNAIKPVVVSARLERHANEVIYWTITSADQRDSMVQELTQTRQQLHEKIDTLQRLSFTDKLTGLANRDALTRHLDRRTKKTDTTPPPFALAFVDLDGFKEVNDHYGHAMGDELLRQVARRMTENIRANDFIARLGGDEFVIILNGDLSPLASERILSGLIEQLATPFTIESVAVPISASIGVTFYPQATNTAPDQLIRQADHAMYQAKLAGRGHVHLFNADKERHLRDHSVKLNAIKAAMTANQFALYYQPKVNMRTGEILSVEALLRWQHPERGILGPADFLPTVNETTVGFQLGEWVMAKALTQLQIWQQQGLRLGVSVNISGYHLQHPEFLKNLGNLLSNYPPGLQRRLELEVLETSTIKDIHQVSEVLSACKGMGIRVSLDDFGTGYSTLGHLRDLSVDALKIDRSFTKYMSSNESDMAILKGVIGLARAFECDVIAEGVETREHGEKLIELGCEWGQGFYITEPLPANSLKPWFLEWHEHGFQDKFGSESQENDSKIILEVQRSADV